MDFYVCMVFKGLFRVFCLHLRNGMEGGVGVKSEEFESFPVQRTENGKIHWTKKRQFHALRATVISDLSREMWL